MDTPHRTHGHLDVALELAMARDESGRPIDEETAMQIRFYVQGGVRDAAAYRAIATAVVAVHVATGAMTIATAVHELYLGRVKGAPDGAAVAEALRYALH